MAREGERRIRGSSEALLQVAREMRHVPTAAEAKLWRGLRGRYKAPWRFRRQHPAGRFVMDFCCRALKLVIELDGDVHEKQAERDAARTAALEATGYRVIRFRNDQVLERLPWVLTIIDEAVAKRRTEAPPPFMGEGGAPKRAG